MNNDTLLCATFTTKDRTFSLKVEHGTPGVEILTFGVIRGKIAAMGLYRASVECTEADNGVEKNQKLVFWMVCTRKGKMWVAEKFKFVCANYRELFDQITTALLQTAPTTDNMRSTTPYGTSKNDVVEYYGMSYMLAVVCRRVSVKEGVAGLNNLRSVILYNQNESTDTRSEIEVGDYCGFRSTTPRALTKVPIRK